VSERGPATKLLLGPVAPACAGLAAIGASLYAAPGLAGLCGALLAALMLAIAVVDARMFLIPNGVNLAVAGLGAIDVVVENPGDWSVALGEAGLRAALAAVFFLAFRILYRRLRGREGMGMGDVKLAGAAGFWLDLRGFAIAVEIAAVTGLVVVMVMRARTGRRVDRFEKLPFGALLAPAIWLCWLLRQAGF
jgi:leader peptidase (prepilin peptidase) / N-methyltransferase